MEQKNTEELLKKIHEGTANEDELNLFEQWYLQFETEPKHYSEEELTRIKKQMSARLPVRVISGSYKLWPRFVAAASIILVLGMAAFYGLGYLKGSGTHVTWTTGDISSGKNAATITLANGQDIQLSDDKKAVIIDAAKLTYDDGQGITGTSAAPSRAIGTMSVNTPRGGAYQIILPDRTHVWLNADSKLTFPSQFAGTTRKINLTGEAYFEVAKDPKHPFVVETGKQSLQVLGTHFNINAYSDEPEIRTTLFEGAVKLSNSTDEKAISELLSPGQQALFKGTGFSISKADVQSAISWKNGEFIFNDEPLESVLRKVSRWYNVTIIYQGSMPRDFAIGGFVSREQPLSVILETIAKTKKVNFRVEGRKVFVSP